MSVTEVKEFYRNMPKDYCGGPDSSRMHIVRALRLWQDAKSVFEFGCASGLNLRLIKDALPHVEVFGIDINPEAVNYGRHIHKVPLEVGDETYLASMKEKSFDWCITRSVLNHIPSEELVSRIIEELKRISRQFVYCMEVIEPLANDKFMYVYDYTKFGLKLWAKRLDDRTRIYGIWVYQHE